MIINRLRVAVLREISYKNDCEESVEEIVIKSTNYAEKLIQSQWTGVRVAEN
jgi:hypothetical protein